MRARVKAVYPGSTVKFRSLSRILCVLSSLAASGCAVAPISNHLSARTNGEGGSLLTAGTTLGIGNKGWVPSIKYSIGLKENLDLGFQYEVIEWGAFLKYQLSGGRGDGFALSGLLGTGLSYEGFYGYVGPVLSWKMGIFEPYFIERYNYVNFPNSTNGIDVREVGEVHVDPGTYHYLQHSFGFFIWPNEWFAFGAETSLFTPIKGAFILRGHDRYVYSGQVSFRF